jgi:hypothetical protein
MIQSEILSQWEAVYRSYSIERLREEIELLHQFQHSLILDLADKKRSVRQTIGVILASQARENLILDMIVDKLTPKENVTQ